MKKGRRYNIDEIEVIAKSSIGKTFKDLKEMEMISISDEALKKGGLGQIVEMALFGIDSNNDSEPDFMPAGVELKVTPYKKLSHGNKLSAKERLVLNIIDYNTEFANEFKSSHFWFKNNKIQLIWYLYEENKDKLDYIITHEKFLNLALNKDLKQIEEDYYTIINKIKEGKAHELSEADTMYLGACTKGANASALREQPFSDIKAKQRAFCFKNSYMTQLVRKYIGNYDDVEKILSGTSKSFQEYIKEVADRYIGKTQTELMNMFNIKSKAKNINDLILRKMFNTKSFISKTDEFIKANIITKTIRVEENGNIIQSMSFPAFKFKEIVNENWEDSTLRETFETTKFMFFIFKHNGNDYVFKGIKLWNMPETIIDSNLKETWEKTVDVLKSGNIVKGFDKRGRRITNFPGMSDNKVCHVRPHGRNVKDTYDLPVTDKVTGDNKYTKQCFWLNNSYLKEILKEFI